jgi:hypothetical protein
MKWRDLNPEPGIVAALEHAGIRPEDGDQNDKRKWSASFANGCAVAFAHKLKKVKILKAKKISPQNIGHGVERLTPLGSGTKKRIDVTVVDSMLGLEIGVSLKGFNFRDEEDNSFSKNLTGRLYELGDEVRLVHEYLPKAFMAGVLFLPLASTEDKNSAGSISSFGQAVQKLKERTGRLDASLAAHSARCDAGYVALYTLGGEIGDNPAGVVRFFQVMDPPPKRGRPDIGMTKSLEEVVDDIVESATASVIMTWSDSEPDD